MTSAARTQLAPREHWSTDALATEDSSAVAKPKAKPAGRSHSFASRLRRAIIGGRQTAGQHRPRRRRRRRR
uniref:Uncharacterized protein n=1 Tax=Macrostomum lignano TaxID=282301 RepID=A0A1I8F8U4_9PLAT